jgi:hypothetical protein
VCQVSTCHIPSTTTTTPFAVVVKDDHENLKSRYQCSAVGGYEFQKVKMSDGNFIGTLLQFMVNLE